jgi:hypothetical protein
MGIGSTELLVFGIIAILLFSRRVEPMLRSLRTGRAEFARGIRDSGFALKDLFASTALIVLGLAWIVVALPTLRYSLDRLESPVWIFVVGGAFFGAGVSTPFKFAVVGTLLGAVVQLLLICTARWFGWPAF